MPTSYILDISVMTVRNRSFSDTLNRTHGSPVGPTSNDDRSVPTPPPTSGGDGQVLSGPRSAKIPPSRREAKLNLLESLAWLTDVLERVVSGRTKRNELHTLLPRNWEPGSPPPVTTSA